uniref:Uncharacterized protein n=1 Tax=Meloidogyne enterolobii TaxID=390850 RepID=A0A6V7WF80_MELEN|nr:unnamed protein product [Meloidogyne enterolobii]
MDDDYDNYVPQISTMDWQNLGQDNESNQMRVESSASAMGPSGSGSYLYGVAGASIPVAGRSQHHQRSFPGMGMPTQPFGVAEYGQGQGYQTNDFVSSGPQSQMMNYQMQSQPVRSFDPMNPNYMTGDPSRQNMLQQGIISAATNAKSTKGARGSKKSKKAMALDQCSTSHQLEPQGIQSTKHMQVHNQLHITNQPYDISNAALKGPGPPANLSALSQASIQNAPHQSVAGFSTSESTSANQYRVSNIQNQQVYGTLQQMQSQYGQTASRQQQQYAQVHSQQKFQAQAVKSVSQIDEQQQLQKSGPVFVPYQHEQPVSVHSVDGYQQQQSEGSYINRQQFLQTGTGNTAHPAVVGYPAPYQAGYASNFIQKQDCSAGPSNSSIGISSPYQQQPYLTHPYNITRQQQQHQHIYRELFECDQQLASLIPQVQQNPELAIRVEKIQIRRQYLHAQLMQINYAMNTAVSAAMGSETAHGQLHSTEMHLSTTSHSVIPPQLAGQYSPHYGGQSSQHQGGLHFSAGHQQKLVNPNLNPYSQQQNCIQPHFSSQQYHPAPPIPPAPYHSNTVGAVQPLSPRQHQHQQPIASLQQFIPPLPSMSSPSVAVMSASNQVQVNIRPEVPGRTLISVYHGQDLQPNIAQPAISTVAADMQQSMNYDSQRQYQFPNHGDQQQDPSAKDSIPPEPLPPNLSREHKRRQQQQKLQEEQVKCLDQPCFQSPDTIRQNILPESENRLPSPPSPPMSLTSVSLSFLACETTANFSKTFPIYLLEVVEATYEASKPLTQIAEQNMQELEVETTVEFNDNEATSSEQRDIVPEEIEVTCNIKRTDIVEQIQEKHLQPQSSLEKSELLSDKSLVDEEDIDDETGSFNIINKKEPKRGIKRRFTDDSDYLEADKVLDIQKPEVETTIEIKSEHLIQSTSETKLEEGTEKLEDSTVEEFQQGDSSTNETTPVDDFAFSFQTTSNDSYNSFAATRQSGKNTTKPRRKKRLILDWNKPDDEDYVTGRSEKRPRINKRASVKRKSGSSFTADETCVDDLKLDSEFFVEKRSSRKKEIDKKTNYGEESDNEYEIRNPLPEQKETKESRIVERILGVRFAKRPVLNSDLTDKKDDPNLDDNEKVLDTEIPLKNNEEVCVVSEESNKEITDEPTKTENSNEKDANEAKLPIQEGETISNKEDLQIMDSEKIIDSENVEEVYVKFKGFSYLHCEWKTIQELEALGDKRVASKLNRWKLKFGNDPTTAGDVQEDDEDQRDFFNEDYTVVSRVLDETYDKKEHQQYVFVKWKSLPYEECTWELEEDVPRQKLLDFRRRSEFDLFKLKEHPKISPKEFSSRLAIPKDKIYNNDNILREYQHEGVNWLLWTWINGRNCILADEMGLGKTVQSIVFLLSLYDIGVHGPFLIVVPLSTLGNWEREFNEWAPEINAIVYHGGAVSRKIIRDYEFFYKKVDGRRRNMPKFDALITTYEVVVQEVEVLRRINFCVCIIDEAHRIKNRNCKLLQSGLLSLRMNHRVLLTGTPLQNNIQELFSLLNFLEPEQFANSEAFLQQFGQCQTEEQVQKLQEILKPMMLRRLKEDVEKELQPKEETIIEVQLSNIQKKYYRAVLERNFTHLMKGTTPSLINTMMQLRKCCCHPYLINGAEEQILNELKHIYPEKSEEERHVIGLISSSGKVVLIDKLLPKLRADGHRVLLFSQMVRVLDLLEEYFNIKGYPFERIDGNIRGSERQAAIDRFSKPENKDCFVFLLCTRAGGLGINLTAADTVIIFDSDWNPQNDLQAQARCHRIGQTKQVKIYRLITANTYEREMFDKASLKLGLDKAVLQSMRTECNLQSSHQLSRQEVEDLLRKGAYGAIMDEDNEDAKFGEEDIDTILERRAQTIKLEPGVKGSTFAKASFTLSHNRDDIDISDPDFWSKWAKKANIDVGALHGDFSSKHLIVHEPRARKKRFEDDNFKGNSESADDTISDDDDRHVKGSSRIAENVKSRSVRKKRRATGMASAGAEDDYKYPFNEDDTHIQGDEVRQRHKASASNRHPELACTIVQLKKVEKLLMQWGWGRWSTLKQFSELSEQELEHISRTLLLHCIREFRGDEKTQEFVWNLITPTECQANISEKSEAPENDAKPPSDQTTSDSKSKFYQGWAQKPEYNPPFICVDMIFQRHLHRNASKLLHRIQAYTRTW